jgi:hypothetical protein
MCWGEVFGKQGGSGFRLSLKNKKRWIRRRFFVWSRLEYADDSHRKPHAPLFRSDGRKLLQSFSHVGKGFEFAKKSFPPRMHAVPHLHLHIHVHSKLPNNTTHGIFRNSRRLMSKSTWHNQCRIFDNHYSHRVARRSTRVTVHKNECNLMRWC